MKTHQYNQQQAIEVAQALSHGKIIAIPTDTVYGLGVLATDKAAILRLKDIKQRPQDKAMAYMVDSLNKIEEVCELSDRDRFLIQKFLPGPITFIFKKKRPFLLAQESKLETLAIRIPDHPFILDVISQMEVGLYVPSANISHQEPSINSQEVTEVFDGIIDGVVLGQAFNGQASTIIDASQSTLQLIRKGVIDFDDVLAGERLYEGNI